MNTWWNHSRGGQRWAHIPLIHMEISQKREKVSAQIARNSFQKREIYKLLGYLPEDWLQNLIMLEILEVQNGKMWLCNPTSICEYVLGKSFVNGNFFTGFHFFDVVKGITSNCKLPPFYKLLSCSLWNPASYGFLYVLRLAEFQRLFILKLQYQSNMPKRGKNKFLTIKLFCYSTTTHFHHLLQPIKYPPYRSLRAVSFRFIVFEKVTHNIKVRELFWAALVIRTADKKMEDSIVLGTRLRSEQLFWTPSSIRHDEGRQHSRARI